MDGCVPIYIGVGMGGSGFGKKLPWVAYKPSYVGMASGMVHVMLVPWGTL